METIRILVVDDSPIVRESLTRLLRDMPDFEVVGSAADGQTAVELAVSLCPDVVLMDVGLPQRNGIQATRQIAAQCPDVRVIAYSIHDGDMLGDILRQAGAATYVVKGTDMGVLLSAIRTVAADGPQPALA